MIILQYVTISSWMNKKFELFISNIFPLCILIAGLFLFTSQIDSVVAQDNNSGKIFPCKLLTSEQVNTVLPDNDGGYLAHSGGSLIKDVDSYQCTYSNDKWEMFSVYVTVAPNKNLFFKIKHDVSVLKMLYKNFHKIKVGDKAWIYGDSESTEVLVEKGYKIIHLKLNSANAGKKEKSLINIASVIAHKIK